MHKILRIRRVNSSSKWQTVVVIHSLGTRPAGSLEPVTTVPSAVRHNSYETNNWHVKRSGTSNANGFRP